MKNLNIIIVIAIFIFTTSCNSPNDQSAINTKSNSDNSELKKAETAKNANSAFKNRIGKMNNTSLANNQYLKCLLFANKQDLDEDTKQKFISLFEEQLFELTSIKSDGNLDTYKQEIIQVRKKHDKKMEAILTKDQYPYYKKFVAQRRFRLDEKLNIQSK